MDDFKSKIILISGPTASGKSNFAVKLAKIINGEIINADSMQIYKEFKILTARPQKKDYKGIPHYLYGFHSVKKNFSTGDWLKKVYKIINKIRKNKKIPIIVGGTGLYFKSLTEGLVEIPKIKPSSRNRIRNLHKKIGQKEFYKNLIRLDPLVKGKISPQDIQRSIRSYEVKLLTKKSIFKWYKDTKSLFNYTDFTKIYIDFPRDKLIKRINERTEKMIKKGAVKEVKGFLRLNIREDNSSYKIIGISEIKRFLENKQNINDTKELISIKTRQYAKRQRTWARGQMSDWIKVHPSNLKKFLKK